MTLTRIGADSSLCSLVLRSPLLVSPQPVFLPLASGDFRRVSRSDHLQGKDKSDVRTG